MKILLTILLLITISTVYGQRWIRQRGTETFLADSTGKVITGNLVYVRNWVRDNMSPDDTARFEIVTYLNVNPGKIIYQIPDNSEEMIDLSGQTTDKINRLRRPKIGAIRFDSAAGKWRGYTKNGWKYFKLEE